MNRLNLSSVKRGIRANGFGNRTVVWVQGCTIGCAGCVNPNTHPHREQWTVDPVALGRRIAADPHCDGLSLSGGEPFQQANVSAILAETVRSAGLSVLIFTGYRYERLERSASPAVQRLLSAADTLVAGPYIAGHRPVGLLASANQRIVQLTDRQTTTTDCDVALRLHGADLFATGIPGQNDRDWLREVVAAGLDGNPGPLSSRFEPVVPSRVPANSHRGL